MIIIYIYMYNILLVEITNFLLGTFGYSHYIHGGITSDIDDDDLIIIKTRQLYIYIYFCIR